jgi:hypothetical protein
MAGVEQVDFRVRVVAFEGAGAYRQDERIVLSPRREKRRPAGAYSLLT